MPIGMRRPSVLFINRVYPPYKGATGRVLRDLAQAFARDGWDVTVLTAGLQPSVEKDGAVTVKRVKAMAAKSLLAYGLIWVKLLWAALRMPKYQMVVTLTDPPLLVVVGRIVARVKRSHHIHWCHDLYPDILPILGLKISPRMMQIMRDISRRAMKSCDRVVVVGRCMARHLAHTGLDMTKVTVIPNWPDFELTSLPQVKPVKIRAAANFNMADMEASKELLKRRPFFVDEDPKFRVLYAGNLGRAHPVGTILDAAALLIADHPEIEFVFVGEGPGFDRIAQERARRGLDNIRLLPTQPSARLRDLMESGDVHLISMKHEAAGMLVPSKLYAALATGRPCILIGPDQTETARVINEYGAGKVLPQGQPRKLALEILKFRTDGDTWFAAQSGALRAGQEFSPPHAISTWIKGARDTIRSRVA